MVQILPGLSRNYRCLRDMEEDVLGVEGKEGIYGDLKKIGDLDLELGIDEVKWIVNQLMRGEEQSNAVIHCGGVIPSLVAIRRRREVGARGGMEVGIGEGEV